MPELKSLFNKVADLQAFGPASLLKREPSTGVFLRKLRNFAEHLFRRTSTNGCFWSSNESINCNISLLGKND